MYRAVRALSSDWAVNSFSVIFYEIYLKVESEFLSKVRLKLSHKQNYLRSSQKWVLFLQEEMSLPFVY